MTPRPSSSVHVTTDGPVALIALDDAARRNALTPHMFGELGDALDHVAHQAQVAVAVLHGRGTVFCSGFDLKSIARDPPVLGEFILRLGALLRQIRGMPQVVIAAVHGAAVAGGCALVSACDLVVVSSTARLGYPVHRLGLSPAVTTSTLIQKMGAGSARAMLVGGELIDGASALDRGLAHVLHGADGDVLPGAMALAQTVAGHGRAALRATKAWLNELDGSLDATRTQRPAEHSAAQLDEAALLIPAFLRRS